MKTQFTKGEWQYALHMNEHYKGKRVVVDDGTKYHRVINICDVCEHPQRPEESNANAKLIAAAPELLKSAIDLKNDYGFKMMIAMYYNQKLENSATIVKINNLFKAIKKATE